MDDYNYQSETVSLMTIHASKGLEFNNIFIPGCEERIIPFQLFGENNEKMLAEEERLFYVGLTRTKQNLFLTYAKSRSYHGRILQQNKSILLDRLEQNLFESGKRKVKIKNSNHGQMELF
jgi:DNA helicase II / ATP-dependent DNA helicase PcrA